MHVHRDFGGKLRFSGQAVTIKCFENNPLVREVRPAGWCAEYSIETANTVDDWCLPEAGPPIKKHVCDCAAAHGRAGR